ncbi:hypothetical protein BAY60_25555 [Prauserella muralis]|uniref:Uncharacterized protein n=1 Tax=Prauserella muralis TaxID=588067 RepID=A0A2V4ALK2_9PSEU|nr:hypothetical protein BAY60_25555 [Prauserella muralis]
MSPWGSNAAGRAWTCEGAPLSAFGPVPGRVTIPAPGSAAEAHLPVAVTDIEASVLVSTNQLATGAWLVPQVRVRRQSSSDYLAVSLELKPDGTHGVAAYEVVGGVATWLGGSAQGAYEPGQWYRLRLQAFGDTVRAKVWDARVHEYDHWQIVYRVSTPPTPGGVSLCASSEPGNTNVDPVITFLDFEVPNPQAFTVTRSTNGVVKTHADDTAVSLANPSVLAL